MTILLLKFLLVVYLAIGVSFCWWGIKCTRQMNITDEETLTLLAILSLASITLWPLFCMMEGVTWDNPFTRAMKRYFDSAIKAYQVLKETSKA